MEEVNEIRAKLKEVKMQYAGKLEDYKRVMLSLKENVEEKKTLRNEMKSLRVQIKKAQEKAKND
jgi:hypothetical protein